MRTPKFILSASVLTASLFVVTACKDSAFLDVMPRTAADSQTALTTPDGFDAAVNGIYDRLQSVVLYGRDMLAVSEALSDNAQFTNKSGRLVSENRNIQGSTFGTATQTGATWLTAYFAINQANLILDNIGNVTFTVADTARRNSFQGQAYFLRALMYHDLSRIYSYDPGVEVASQDRGGVPLLLTGVADQSQIIFPARAATADVYKQIYSDLQSAIAAFTRTNAAAPAYGNLQAANALFSRVALYRKDYATAVKYATAGIAGAIKLSDNASYVGGWRAPKQPESIFEVQFATASENIGVNTSLQTTYTTLVRTGDRNTTGGFGDLVPTTAFIADLEAEKSTTGAVLDIRRQLYELGTAGRGTAVIECTKFLGKNGTINLDNVPAIRVSELYLNRAEANYYLGNTVDALADLNIIRVRSGLVARTATELAGVALLNEIYRQARLEFGFEGHRWFDLKRTGQNVVKATAQGGGLLYTDYRILANIPVNELSTNKNIKQNFGY